MKNFKDALTQARKRLGLTMKEAGVVCGCSASMISRYENGSRTPAENIKKILMEKLGITKNADDEYDVSYDMQLASVKYRIKQIYEECLASGLPWHEYAAHVTTRHLTVSEVVQINAVLSYLIDGRVISIYSEKEDLFIQEIMPGLLEELELEKKGEDTVDSSGSFKEIS